MVKILLIVLLSACSAALYRLGGWSGGNKLYRRIGCPACFLIAVMVLKGVDWGAWWAYLITFGLSAAALSTYHDYLAPDKSSENWLCWMVTGVVYGLAALPLIWTGVHWYAVVIRALALGGLTLFISEASDKDIVEETGRGLFFCLTALILGV